MTNVIVTEADFVVCILITTNAACVT